MNILCIGGSGFLSSRVVMRLLESNHKVFCFTRGRAREAIKHPKLTYIRGDRHNLREFSVAAQMNYDIVYDFIAYDPSETKTAIQLFKGKTGRFIHCSSVAVYMISDQVKLPVTEDQLNAPVMKYWEGNPFGMYYGINKRKCENTLWEVHDDMFPVTIIRPTFICGPNDPGKRDYFWIERIRDGKPILVPGLGSYKFQNVFVNDVAEVFHNIATNNKTIGQAYNVAADEIITLNKYIKMIAEYMKQDVEIINAEQEQFERQPFAVSKYGEVFPFNTQRDAIFSIDKIKEDLNYKSTSMDIWLPYTIDWYLQNAKKHSIGYEKRNDEITFIKKIKKKS